MTTETQHAPVTQEGQALAPIYNRFASTDKKIADMDKQLAVMDINLNSEYAPINQRLKDIERYIERQIERRNGGFFTAMWLTTAFMFGCLVMTVLLKSPVFA